MTKILVAIGDKNYAEDFMMALLPRGYEVYIVEKQGSLFEIARQRKPDVIVFDADIEEYQGIQGLKSIRQDPATRSSSLIVFSKDSSLEFVKSTMKLGAVGYLYKPIAVDELEEKLSRMLDGIQNIDKRREFVRVKPAPLEDSRVEVFVPGHEGISGDLLDISLGGIAFRLNNPNRIGEITIGQVYQNIRLDLAYEESIEVPGAAVLARGDMAAFKFRGIKDSALRILCHYIHERLMSSNKDDPGAYLLQKV